MQSAVLKAIYRGTELGEHKDYGQKWNGIEFDWVANIHLGDSLKFFRRKMRNIYKGANKMKVYHGTSLSTANRIIKGGFLPARSRGRTGIFVSTKKDVAYALEHTYNDNDGVIIECEAYLQKGKYTHDGNTIILESPLSIIPLKIYKTTNVNISTSSGPPMLHRSKTIGGGSGFSLFD